MPKESPSHAVEEQALAPVEFLARKRVAINARILATVCLDDYQGATKADQTGASFWAVTYLLEEGIRWYLAERGRYAVPRMRLLSAFRDLCGEDSPLYRETWHLCTEDPDTPADVADWADRCIDFVEFSLGCRLIARRDEVWSQESMDRFWDEHADVILIAHHLGVEPMGRAPQGSPFTVEMVRDYLERRGRQGEGDDK